ncbi:MAG TPA: right-handed parallel beta-helix repeat-containing protein [Chthoniobacterales bacterium]
MRCGTTQIRRLAGWICWLIVMHSAVMLAAPYSVADDLPGPPSHLETIPAGSLVIPMDNNLQNLVSPFNLKAYGLASNLLNNGVPMKWAIKAGKTKDGIDFTATAQRIAPSAGAPGSFNFSGGPFIVHRDFAQLALAYITAFGGSVAVYQLTADATVDVRYDLHHRPNIAVNTVNASIHTDLYDAAGIPNYTVIDVSVPGSIGPNSCYTHISEPHTQVTAGIGDVKAFVQSGGNFLAECRSIETYENDPAGEFQTTAGIVISNLNNDLDHPNADLAYSQFVGVLNPAPGGSEQDWVLASGSVFQNNGHVHANNIGAAPPTYAATAAKLYNGEGGNVFYLGGHDYGAGGNDITMINGQRMILNALFVPTTRPLSCNLDFLSYLRTFTGKVVEDVNGDSNLGDAVGRPNVNVRLYADLNNNGVVDAGDFYLGLTTTDANGNYTLRASTYASGNHFLVVIDSKSVTPSAGLNGGFSQGDVWAAQTYGDNPATPAVDLGARYGGSSPNTSDSFNLASTVPANNSYRHVGRIDATAGDVSGVDFGFSFNVVTTMRGGDATDDDATANRTVQGSVRQFIQNANAITGSNAMRFVPAVAANAGTWWRLSVTSALPPITDAGTTIDGRAYNNTDGTTVLDANPGTIGTGGSVGLDSLSLTALAKPELEIQNLRSSGVVPVGLDLQAASLAVRRVSIYGFGSSSNSDASANIRVGAPGTSAIIEENLIGTGATAFADPGAAARSVGDDLRLVGAATVTIQNNVIGFSAGNGVALNTNSTGVQVLSNEIRGNGLTNATLSGINVNAGSTATIQGNLVTANKGAGVEATASGGSSTIVNNTISGNGVGGGGAVTAGVRLLGSSNTLDRNVVTGSAGPGVIVGSAATQDTITKNSVFTNGGIGIDLLNASDNQSTGTAPFVTPNDNGDADAGGNGLLNFPVISSVYIGGSNLVIRGFARPGSIIEFFIADPDPSNFGEGKTYIATLTEGSAQDTDASTGTYINPVNGLNQGTDTTARFLFTIPIPPGVAIGTVLTATATLSNATSEFSGNVTVAQAQADVSGFVYNDANLNLQRDSGESGTALTLYVKLVNTTTPAGPATAVATVDPATGAYTLPNVATGTYTLVLDDNNNLADVTPTLSAGWSGTEMASGLRTPVAVNLVGVPNQNFGLFHGLLITGSIFADTGVGGGVANDGVMNGAEGGIGGLALKLTDGTGATIYGTSTTNGNGAYALAIPSTVAAGAQLKAVATNAANFVSTGASLGNTAGTFDRPTDAITFTLAANTTYSGVNFGDVPPNTLSTDGQQAGLPGTTLFYAHTFIPATAGSVAFSVNSTPLPALSGWTTTIYRDTNANGQLDSGEPEITGPVTVNAGDVVAILAKVFIPAAAPLGAKDQNIVTANFSYTGSTPLLTVPITRQDATTVGNPTTAGLTLSKSVDKQSALPGDTINYTIAYANNSSDTLRNVIIYDTTPVFTKFTSAGNGPLPLDITGVVITAPSAGQTGAMRWTFAGTLRPAGTGTVTFQVTVDQ